MASNTYVKIYYINSCMYMNMQRERGEGKKEGRREGGRERRNTGVSPESGYVRSIAPLSWTLS